MASLIPALSYKAKSALLDNIPLNYLAKVQESDGYKNAPETEPTLREKLQTEVHKILDKISFKEFFNHPNRNKK
jgi:hypothetical protein